ncbi:MAG TPA: acyl-CoA reductase [Candidatus Baltobacteraceae bacterium]
MSLREIPAHAIVRAVADAAQRWSDADFPPRVRLLDGIAQRTGYSVPVVEHALDQLFFSMSEPALRATIEGELGSLAALDGFVRREGRPRSWARGLERVAIISSRTTIGVAVAPAVFALCAKARVLVKDREDGLIGAFFATLAEELDDFREAARAQSWDSNATAEDLRTFDAVVAFGRTQTLAEIRATVGPEMRFIAYGPRASAGYVAREQLCDEGSARAIAQGAARDLVLYDAEGCMSLHALFVESGGSVSPTEFGRLLAEQVERASIEFPLGERQPAAAASVANARNLAAFRSATGHGTVFADERATYALFLNPPFDEAPLFLPRSVGIHAVESPAGAAAYLRRHGIALEAFALHDKCRSDVVAMAVDSGAVRLAQFGELQRPPLSGDHGGRPRIADFIRWIDNDL